MNQGENNPKKFNVNTETGMIESPYDMASEEEVSTENPSSLYEENGTFCRAGSTSGGFIEIDLRSVKQRGTEDRYISFKVIGFDEQENVSKSEMLCLDEDLFKKLKEFISKLNWND